MSASAATIEAPPTRQPLTPRQAEVLRFIVAFLQRHWRQPTLREIARAFGHTGVNGPSYVVNALRRKGWLVRDKGLHGAWSFGVVPGCRMEIYGLNEAIDGFEPDAKETVCPRRSTV